ncbi:MAG: hypothetical protein IAF94_18965 [Pirellulaceae bacterium]|nr:hypothetical protein [Pirellulaceae bacterium]
MFDHLEAGYSLDEFLEQFPTVPRELVLRLLKQLKEQTVESAR